MNRNLCRMLASCDEQRCCSPFGGCKEVCAFGSARRREHHTRKIQGLLANELDLFEVRVSRARWTCPIDELGRETITAALQLNRRALDRICETVVGVGMVKVFALPASEDGPDSWCWEIHEFVSCTSQSTLEEAFSPGRPGADLGSYVCVKPVDSLSDAIDRVLMTDPQEWCHPRILTEPMQANKRFRDHYFRWLRWLDKNERLIRYGCDGHFNRLNKPPRLHRPPPKKRPYPRHLERHMFGNHPMHCQCIACGGLGRKRI